MKKPELVPEFAFVKVLIFGILLLAGLFTLPPQNSLAYFTDWNDQEDEFRIGTNTIAVTGKSRLLVDPGEGDNIYRNCVQVTNTGTIPCYVRVFLDFADGDVKGKTLLSADGDCFYPVSQYTEFLPESWRYIPGEEDQLLGGYYYSTEILRPGESTIPVLEWINVSFEAGETMRDCEIIVYAESVQILDKEGMKFTGADDWKQAWAEFLERR